MVKKVISFYSSCVAVQQLHHLKSTQSELLEEVERLMQENENLKK